MTTKENIVFLGVIIITLGNIIGIIPVPLAAISTLTVVAAIFYRHRLTVICKTLPRDLKGIKCLLKSYGRLRLYKKNNWTIIDLFRQQLKENPRKVCIYFENEMWTYENIEAFSNRVSNVFLEAGYTKGDVVALLMENCPEYVCTWLGLAKIGVITALINTNLRRESLIHCLRVGAAKAVIFGKEYSEAINEIAEDLNGIVKYMYQDGGEGSEVLTATNLSRLVDYASTLPPNIIEPVGFRDRILYIYTSGTTGLPKPAIIPHHRLLLLSLPTICVFDIKQEDIVYNPLPLYHSAGGMIGIAGPLCHGYSVVLRRKFSASSYWTDCIKYKCTAGQYIGEMCRYIQMVPPGPQDSQHSVRILFGNGIRANIMEAFQSRFKVDRICEFYGSTEGNANIVNIDKKLGAVGFLPNIVPASLLPMALIKVNEKGEPLRNEDGFCIRCQPNEQGMFIGMIRNNDITREYSGYVGSEKENQKKILENVFKKGDRAFVSGDILIMDQLGYLYFKDRTGDTFRWKGENVSTTEVEEVIAAIIGLKEVTVYGVEVENCEGRAGMAAIVDPDGETNLEELHIELKKRLPPYARPIFLRVNKQPDMTGTYKLKKYDLQKEGFNPTSIRDKLFFNSDKGFTDLTADIYENIISGKIRA